MDIDNYLHYYEAFSKEFFPDETIKDIEAKMFEEALELVAELDKEVVDRAKSISETIDNMNMSIKLLNAYGIKNPLMAGYLKLQQTANKYRTQQKNSNFVLEGGEGDKPGTSSDPAAN